MSATIAPAQPFTPGTTGWTAADLDDPRIEAKWMRGSYEIVDRADGSGKQAQLVRPRGPMSGPAIRLADVWGR